MHEIRSLYSKTARYSNFSRNSQYVYDGTSSASQQIMPHTRGPRALCPQVVWYTWCARGYRQEQPLSRGPTTAQLMTLSWQMLPCSLCGSILNSDTSAAILSDRPLNNDIKPVVNWWAMSYNTHAAKCAILKHKNGTSHRPPRVGLPSALSKSLKPGIPTQLNTGSMLFKSALNEYDDNAVAFKLRDGDMTRSVRNSTLCLCISISKQSMTGLQVARPSHLMSTCWWTQIYERNPIQRQSSRVFWSCKSVQSPT